MYKRHWLRHRTISPIVSKRYFGGYHRPQPSSLIALTWASLLVQDFILFTQLIDWSPQTIRQLVPSSENSLQRGSDSMGMRSTWTIQLNLFAFSACSRNWILGSSILCLPSQLLAQFSHHSLPTPQRLRSPNTESVCTPPAFNGHVSEH